MRLVWKAIAGVIILLSANLWAYNTMADRRETAIQSAGEVAECRQLVQRIKAMSARPMLAAARSGEADELAPKIEKSAIASDIPAGSVVRITPASPRRLEESPYREHAIEVVVETVTLRQCLRFLSEVTGDGHGIIVKSIHLSAMRGHDTEDLWNLETTFSSLEFSPRETGTKTALADQ